eukprot:scaffold495690_cov38-Prasinocladus_malaysianus.AAC.1
MQLTLDATAMSGSSRPRGHPRRATLITRQRGIHGRLVEREEHDYGRQAQNACIPFIWETTQVDGDERQ